MFLARRLCISIFVTLLSPAVFAIPIYSGSGTDAEGDVARTLFADPALHDLASVLVEVDDSTFFARILFHGDTYRAISEDNSSNVGIGLDLDQNPDTGFPGKDSNNTDSESFGLDALIDLTGGLLEIASFSDTGFLDGRLRLGSSGVNELINGIEVSIPLVQLSDDEGQLSFFVTAQQSLGGSASSGIVDYMADTGVQAFKTSLVTTPPPPTVPVPEPASVALMALGLFALGTTRRRQRNKRVS